MSSPALSLGEEKLALHIRALDLPACEREYRFKPPRKWRFDFAWPRQRVACEVEGGVYSGGRHTRGKGFEADCEKYNAAALDGWAVLRVTTGMVNDGRAVELLRAALENEG